MSESRFRHARESVTREADANNLATQRRMLAEWEKVLVGFCTKASNHEPVTI